MGRTAIGIAALVGLLAGPARAGTLPSPFRHHVTVDTRQAAALDLGEGVDTVLVVVDGDADPATAAAAAGLVRGLGSGFAVAEAEVRTRVSLALAERPLATAPALDRCRRVACDAIVAVLPADGADARIRVFGSDGAARFDEVEMAPPAGPTGRRDRAAAAGAALGRSAVPTGGLERRAVYATGSPELRAAYASARDGRWREATRLWTEVAAGADPRDAAKASANLSVAYERRGELVAARDAARVAHRALGTARTEARLAELRPLLRGGAEPDAAVPTSVSAVR